MIEIIVEAIRQKDVTVAANVIVLISNRAMGSEDAIYSLNEVRLYGLFAGRVEEVVGVLDELSVQIQEVFSNEPGRVASVIGYARSEMRARLERDG